MPVANTPFFKQLARQFVGQARLSGDHGVMGVSLSPVWKPAWARPCLK